MIRELFLEDLSLWSCVWQSTLLIVIGFIGSFLYRHRPARAFQVLLFAMIAAVAVPVMSLAVKHYEIGAFVAKPTVFQSEVMNASSAPNETFSGSSEVETQNQSHKKELGLSSAGRGSIDIDIPWCAFILFTWLSASIVLLGRLLVAFIKGLYLLKHSTSLICDDIQHAANSAMAKLGITKSLNIRSSKAIRSPMIWCWGKIPVLLVPNNMNHDVDWSGVICHELAHFIPLLESPLLVGEEEINQAC